MGRSVRLLQTGSSRAGRCQISREIGTMTVLGTHWLGRTDGMKKSDVLELLQHEPEDLDVDKFIYTLWVRRKIERALASPEEEDIPHEEVEGMIDEWLASPGRPTQ